MRVLLDECLDPRLARFFKIHDVRSVKQMGWLGVTNGSLLALASEEFEAFVTVDKNIPHEQNLGLYSLRVCILDAGTLKLERLAPLIGKVEIAISAAEPGQVITVS